MIATSRTGEGQKWSKTSEQDGATGTDFDGFPFPPYPIQQDLMEALYSLLQKGGIGLFESPTGTGKTLSLICGALKWLEETKKSEEDAKRAATCSQRGKQDPEPSTTSSTQEDVAMPLWLSQPAEVPKQNVAALGSKNKVVASSQTKSKQAIKAASPALKGFNKDEKEEDTEFILPAWHDEKDEHIAKKRRLSDGLGSSDSESEQEGEGEDIPFKSPQIFFCSRTHSQLSQFVGELKRTKYKDSMALAALASRQTLCINKDVVDLGNGAQINERCLDLQDASSKEKKNAKSKKAAKGCPFLPKRASIRESLRDAILSEPIDVEELSSLGARKSICPYYASRSAQPGADLILLPYSALLSKEARESIGLQLENSVIIVDEAHNLVSAVHDTHSATVTAQQTAVALAQLTAYHLHFQSRLAPGNEQNIQLLIYVGERLLAYFKQISGQNNEQGQGALAVNDFLFASGIDSVNLFNLLRYVKETRLIYRVSGFSIAKANREAKAEVVSGSSKNEAPANSAKECSQNGQGCLQTFMTFLSSLNNPDTDGRIIFDPKAGTCKFILLNASAQFSKILDSAHAVVLASGTLSPTASLQRQLFPHRRVEAFSCGHVIQKDRLLALAVGCGPSGASLNFKLGHRSQAATLEQLGRLLVNICQAVPQGIVVFFPSFGYCEEVQQAWAATGLLRQISSKKKLYVEPRASSQVEATLKDYAKSILLQEGKGAILLCVVGGKMSEGINFGDGLGRCVVMVGLPYPNAADPELSERMKRLDLEDGIARHQKTAASSGQVYYEDLCMKAVNQCIGRVIRHRNDWAAIVMADARWVMPGAANAQLRGKLPGWIQGSLHCCTSFGDAYSRLTHFCRSMA